MKTIFKKLLVCCLAVSSFFGGNLLNTHAASSNEYISYEVLSEEEISHLLETYDAVIMYDGKSRDATGTYTKVEKISDTTSAYGFVRYHPYWNKWGTATAYGLNESKTVTASITVTLGDESAQGSFEVYAGVEKSTSGTAIYSLSDSDAEKVTNGNYVSRLAIYAKVRKQLWHYYFYENSTGNLVDDYPYAYVTTWDKDGNEGQVSYKTVIKVASGS